MTITRTYQSGNLSLRVLEVHYHRNGVMGEGFYAVAFRVEDASLIGIVFDGPGQVAVINPRDVTDTWRGDDFEHGLRRAVEEYESRAEE